MNMTGVTRLVQSWQEHETHFCEVEESVGRHDFAAGVAVRALRVVAGGDGGVSRGADVGGVPGRTVPRTVTTTHTPGVLRAPVPGREVGVAAVVPAGRLEPY